ncbi:hypothetical protein V8E36_000009 [Tilletia maclaganii]
MNPDPSQNPEASAGLAAEQTPFRPPRPLHRVPSKQLGSGSGAGLWLSTGGSPSNQSLHHNQAHHPTEGSEGSENSMSARVRFHDSAKPQAVSPTAAAPINPASKLYHFPATLAQGLRFLSHESPEAPVPASHDPVAELQEHNLLRMSSKEELEGSVDLDLSFDYMSTAERPLPPPLDPARDPLLSIANRQSVDAPVQSISDEMEDLDDDAVSNRQPRQRTSTGSNYSGQSKESYQTAGLASVANSSTDNVSGNVSNGSVVPPLPTVPSVIWKQRKERIERQVAAAAITRASAVPAAFAIETVTVDNAAVVRPPVPPIGEDNSPRMSFGFQSPTPEKLKRWSSIPSQLAALVVAAGGPIQPAVAAPPLPKTSPRKHTSSNPIPSPLNSARLSHHVHSPLNSARLSVAQTPSTNSSPPFSPLFSDPGTVVSSAATTMSRTSTHSTSMPKPGAANGRPGTASTVGEDAADVTLMQHGSVIGPQKRGSVGTAAWIKEQSSQHIPLERQSGTRDSQASTASSVLAVSLAVADARRNSVTGGEVITSDSEVEADDRRARNRPLPMHITLGSESTHGEASTWDLELRNTMEAPAGPWPGSPLLLNAEPNAESKEMPALPKEYSVSTITRAHRSSQLNSMLGLGLGLDLGTSSDIRAPQDARLSVQSGSRSSLLRKTASDSGLGLGLGLDLGLVDTLAESGSGSIAARRKSASPHTEIDMSLFADQGPEPTTISMHQDIHNKTQTTRRSRLLDMLLGSESDASTAVPALAVENRVIPVDFGATQTRKKAAMADTPSTLPLLSPRPISSPYLGRQGLDYAGNSSVEAFACNVTPPMPSVAFPERGLAGVQRGGKGVAGERKSEGHSLGSSWLREQSLSHRVATASWLPVRLSKQEAAEIPTRPVKEKHSPLPTPIALFESTSEARTNNRVSIASAVSNSETRMRRRRSTMTNPWTQETSSPIEERYDSQTTALSQVKRRRTVDPMFGNAAFYSPARTPATTNMMPNGTLLSKSLFFAGFCGMPWLWLVGGWWLGPDGHWYSDMPPRSSSISDEDYDISIDSNGEKKTKNIHPIAEMDEDEQEEWYVIDPNEATSRPASRERDRPAHDPVGEHVAESGNMLHPTSAALQRDGSGPGRSTTTRSTTVVTSDNTDGSSSAESNDVNNQYNEHGRLGQTNLLPKKKKKNSSSVLDLFYPRQGAADWNELEKYVRYNRIASVFGALFILLALILAIRGIAINW